MDSPVFENYPNRSYANYIYNSMGYVDDTYGMAKTAVRLAVRLADPAFVQIGAEQIQSVVSNRLLSYYGKKTIR